MAELEMNVTKRKAKSAKDAYDSMVLELRKRIAAGVSKQPTLPGLFDPEPQQDEAWKSAPISQVLTATEKQLEKLIDAGIETAGDFERVRGGGDLVYPRGLASIKGVGQASIDKWEENILDWLDKNRANCKPDAKPDDEDE